MSSPRGGYRVLLTARGHGSLARAAEVLGDDVAVDPVESPLADGFLFAAGRLAVITEEDLFGSRRHTRSAPRFTRRRTDSIAEELEPGDYAVHRIHGVGRYTGITHRELAGAERDYLVLEYAGGRQALRAERRGRHGGEVRGRRRAAAASHGR